MDMALFIDNKTLFAHASEIASPRSVREMPKDVKLDKIQCS